MTPSSSSFITATLLILIFSLPALISGASCGTYGTLRRPKRIKEWKIPGDNKVGLVAGCERLCKDSTKKCQGFAVTLSNSKCETFSNIMEKQGMARSDSYDTLHYDMSCFEGVSDSSSTKVNQNLTSSNDAYTCIPSSEQAIFNPSFENGFWVGFAHGWTLRGSKPENVPRRDAIGNAWDESTNMLFEVLGTGTSTISQTLCVVPGLKYKLSAHIGHVSYKNVFGEFEFYYHAPTLNVYLDRDLIYKNSVCGPHPDVYVTECQPTDGTYFEITKIVKPLRSTPVLTFEFEFDARPGKKSYKGLLDLVEMFPADPLL